MLDISWRKTYLLCCATIILFQWTESKLDISSIFNEYLYTYNVFVWSSGKKVEYVTCGTVTKLYNTDFKVRLHSHDVKYGAGSGQQSVTGTEVAEDINSHWEIKAPTGKHCKRGYAIS